MINLKVVQCLKTYLLENNIAYSVKYAVGESPFGSALVMTVSNHIVYLKFVESLTDNDAHAIVSKQHPEAESITKVDQDEIKDVIDIKNLDKIENNVSVIMKGTKMQETVWNVLLTIPKGQTLHYGDVATRAGYSVGAARAVGGAMKQNCVGYLVPCHRILKKNSDVLNYSCGPVEVRRRMLKHEGVDV